jgi:hypothetical protein
VPSSKGKDQAGTPRYPETPPPTSPSGDFGYFEFVMQVHNSLGMLTEAVTGLKEDVKELKAEQKELTKKIEGINKRIYAAIVILTLAGFLLQLFGSSINSLITRSPAPSAVQQPAK